MDTEMLNTYQDLKRKMTAAHTVLKKKPTYQNVTRYNTATQTFNNFCIKAMAELADDHPSDNKAQILANVDEYRTCKKCGTELLLVTDERNYVASSEFVPDFPGWCHTCLLERHCLRTACEECTIVSDPATCSYKEIKSIYQEDGE